MNTYFTTTIFNNLQLNRTIHKTVTTTGNCLFMRRQRDEVTEGQEAEGPLAKCYGVDFITHFGW